MTERNELCQHTCARKARSHGSQVRVLRNPLVHVATVTVFLACSGERPVSLDAMTRDSAGVMVVQSRLPLWTDEQQWVLDTEPVVDLGGPADDHPVFLGVRAVRVLSNGNLVVASGRLNAVTMFDSTGALIVELGGRGEGPGEFSRIRDVYHCANDTVVVDDFTRLSFFDAEGGFARTIRLSRSAELYQVEGVYSTCAEAVVQASAYLLPTYGEVGTVESSLTTINLADLDGRGAPLVFPSFRVWHRVVGGGGVPVRLPWAARAHWVISGDRMYLGLSDRPEIRVHSPSGDLVQIIRWDQTPRTVSRDDRSSYGRLREQWIPEIPPLRDVLPRIQDYPELPRSKPYFSTILLDELGNLWVREYPKWVAGRPDLFDFGGPVWKGGARDVVDRWRVFNLDGQLLGSVLIPADLAVMSVDSGHVVGVKTDQFDVEHVVVYRLIKP